MPPFEETWTEDTPTNDLFVVDVDNEIRKTRKALRERLAVEHEFRAAEVGHDDIGEHLEGSARIGRGIAANRPLVNVDNPGKVYKSTDTGVVENDTGVEWENLFAGADPSSSDEIKNKLVSNAQTKNWETGAGAAVALVGGVEGSIPYQAAPIEVGDTQDQLSGWVLIGCTLANTDKGTIYWKLTNSVTTRTVSLYKNKDGAAENLVAQGARSGDGVVDILEQNVSGLSSSVTVTYLADDVDVENNTLTVATMFTEGGVVGQFLRKGVSTPDWADLSTAFTIIDSAVLAASQRQVLAHGLGKRPAFVQTSLLCAIAEQGFSVDDEIFDFPNFATNTINYMWGIIADETNIITQTYSTVLYIPHKTNVGSFVTITWADWKFRVRVFLGGFLC